MKVLLSDEEKDIFLDGMSDLTCNGSRNPFVKMAEILPYNPRQLCHYWRNYLDPNVCKDSLNDDEKQYIDNWISINKTDKGGIEWKNLRQDLKEKSDLPPRSTFVTRFNTC
ncbi:hypothetical protein C1645_743335 [Glomus cerebriforme]|uniref:HTH myb-type domain-containing protein n=1 Tax=Glomus cerebriforme TaxID=658196 RepID=A0A397SEA8_9GLOM|nr:hypothetical protein C1645_743335 [Glomus cerebriforme]